jgi:hypothetical protein
VNGNGSKAIDSEVSFNPSPFTAKNIDIGLLPTKNV